MGVAPVQFAGRATITTVLFGISLACHSFSVTVLSYLFIL